MYIIIMSELSLLGKCSGNGMAVAAAVAAAVAPAAAAAATTIRLLLGGSVWMVGAGGVADFKEICS